MVVFRLLGKVIVTKSKTKEARRAAAAEAAAEAARTAGDSDDAESPSMRGSAAAVVMDSHGRELFKRAKRWNGGKPGAVFKLGALGLGYYLDINPLQPGAVSAEAAIVAIAAGGSGGGGGRGRLPSGAAEAGDAAGVGVAAAAAALTVLMGDGSVHRGGAPAAFCDAVDVFGGCALHAPNGFMWWGLAGALVVSLAGDADFVSGSSARARAGLGGFGHAGENEGAGTRRGDRVGCGGG